MNFNHPHWTICPICPKFDIRIRYIRVLLYLCVFRFWAVGYSRAVLILKYWYEKRIKNQWTLGCDRLYTLCTIEHKLDISANRNKSRLTSVYFDTDTNRNRMYRIVRASEREAKMEVCRHSRSWNPSPYGRFDRIILSNNPTERRRRWLRHGNIRMLIPKCQKQIIKMSEIWLWNVRIVSLGRQKLCIRYVG